MTDLDDLADRVDDAVKRATQPATFELVRACLNEAGLVRARRAIFDAADAKAAALEAKRDADAAERKARAALDAAELDADWTLVPPDVNEAGAKLLADDKKAWKKREVAKQPDVVAAAQALRHAEHDTAAARDAVSTASDRFKACCADLDAAIATINALREALPARKGGSE